MTRVGLHCAPNAHRTLGTFPQGTVRFSFGYETAKKFNPDFIKECLEKLGDFGEYGQVLRAKGIVEAEDGQWIHFDYVPGEPDVRFGSAEVTGRIVVIGAGVDEDAVKELFGI